MTTLKDYTPREEKANALTHWIGVGIAPIAAIIFLTQPIVHNNPHLLFSISIMLIGMLSSFLSSSLYHSAHNPQRKARLRKFDHAAIYLNIAGCYTPFLLHSLQHQPHWSYPLLALIWGGALLGIGLNFRKMKKTNLIKTLSYLLLGWVALIAIIPLYHTFLIDNRIDVFYWLGAEAFFYTTGAFIYAFAKREYSHTLWHLFVLAGAIAHLGAVYRALF